MTYKISYELFLHLCQANPRTVGIVRGNKENLHVVKLIDGELKFRVNKSPHKSIKGTYKPLRYWMKEKLEFPIYSPEFRFNEFLTRKTQLRLDIKNPPFTCRYVHFFKSYLEEYLYIFSYHDQRFYSPDFNSCWNQVKSLFPNIDFGNNDGSEIKQYIDEKFGYR